MRLIDADALPNELFKKRVHDGEELEPMMYFEDAVKVVENAPTIDAIPVEWLREKMQKPLITSANPFDYVLEAWEQDNKPSPTCGPDYCDID